jgi:hypothetical protein
MTKTAFTNRQGRVICGLLLLGLAEPGTVASAQAGPARTVSADYPAAAPLNPRGGESCQYRYGFQHVVAPFARDILLRLGFVAHSRAEQAEPRKVVGDSAYSG